jgi:hypothetical protein
MPRHARAECNDCGETWEGTLEQVSDRVDDHDQFHNVDIQPVATDGGHPPGPSGGATHQEPEREGYSSPEDDDASKP